MNNNNLPEDLGDIKPTADPGEEKQRRTSKETCRFRDFMVVDTSYTGNEYLAYQSHKRHRGTVGESTEVGRSTDSCSTHQGISAHEEDVKENQDC